MKSYVKGKRRKLLMYCHFMTVCFIFAALQNAEPQNIIQQI